MEFTRRGGLPETGCLPRDKIDFGMAACWRLRHYYYGDAFNARSQNREMLTLYRPIADRSLRLALEIVGKAAEIYANA